MKIKKIEIKNFKGTENLVLDDPSPFVVFAGNIGTGKTSVLEAFRWALTGDVDDNCIRRGQKSAKVVIEWVDGDSIERVKAKSYHKIRVNGTDVKLSEGYSFIEQKLGVSPDLYRAMLEGKYLESLEPKEFTRFISGILPITYTEEKLEKLFEELTTLTEEERSTAISEMHARSESSVYNISDIEGMYKVFYDKRAGQASVKNHVEQECKTALPERPKETMEELDAMLEKAGHGDALKAKYEAEKKAYRLSLENHTSWDNTRKKLVAELEEMKEISEPDPEEVKRVTDLFARHADWENSMKQKIADLKQYINGLNRDIQELSSASGTYRNNISRFGRAIENLNRPVCPLSNKLVCRTDKSGIRQEMEKAVNENRNQLENTEKLIGQKKQAVEQYDKAISDLQDKIRSQLEKKNSMERAMHESETAWQRKQKCQKELEKHMGEEPKVLPEPEGPKDEAQLNKEEILSRRDILNAYKKREEKEKELAEENALYTALDHIVKCFDPKNSEGIVLRLMEKAYSLISANCTKRADELGASMQFDFRKDTKAGLMLYVKTSRAGDFIPWENLSNGEHVLASYILMSLIRALKNVQYLALDNIDSLDADSAARLAGVIRRDDTFSLVMTACVGHPDIVQAMETAGAQVIRM